MKTLKKIKTKEAVTADGKQVWFEKKITADTGSNIIALAVQLEQAKEEDVRILSTVTAGEIMGLTGNKKAIDRVLSHINVDNG